MKLPQFVLSTVSGLFFLLMLYVHGYFSSTDVVSRGTVSQNITHTIVEGIDSNGLFVIARMGRPTDTPTRLKKMNRSGTLRAFVGNNTGGGPKPLIVESIFPHEYFHIAGNFSVLNPARTLRWSDGETLSFSAEFSGGVSGEMHINVATLTSTMGNELLSSYENMANEEIFVQ